MQITNRTLMRFMDVCHLTTGHSVFDERILHKECKTLKKAGFKVFLIAPCNEDMTIDGIFVRALPKPKNKFDRIFKNTFLGFIMALKVNAQLYHFHDPELILVGFCLKLVGKRVIYDVHEDVPKQIVHKNMFGNKVINKIIAKIFSYVQKAGSSFFDGIVGVSPSIVSHFKEKKSVLIRNFVILDLVENAQKAPCGTDRFVCIYPGGLSKKRGIKEIVQAIGILGGKVELLLMGNWENAEFRKECECLKGWLYTKYMGHVELQEVYKYMKASTIGMINYYESGTEAIPNKPFEYMACGLPMVMSNRPDWKILFKGSALFVNPRDPVSIAEKINVLVENDVLRKNLGKMGQKMVERRFNWESEGKRLVEFYKKLIATWIS